MFLDGRVCPGIQGRLSLRAVLLVGGFGTRRHEICSTTLWRCLVFRAGLLDQPLLLWPAQSEFCRSACPAICLGRVFSHVIHSHRRVRCVYTAGQGKPILALPSVATAGEGALRKHPLELPVATGKPLLGSMTVMSFDSQPNQPLLVAQVTLLLFF